MRERLMSSCLRTVAGVAAVLLTALPALALPQGQQELAQKRQRKLEKPVFHKAAWLTDYDAARAQAKQAGTLLLVYFTRSYAPCEPCEALEANLLAADDFVAWSKKVTLCLHITSQLTDEAHANLLYEMGGNGFPTLSFLDADGNLLQQVGGGETTLDDLERQFRKLAAWKALRAEVEAGKTEKERELFALELQMGNRPFAEMRARAQRLQFADAERPRIEQQMVNLEFTEILRQTPRQEKAKGGARLRPMFEAGRIPDSANDTSYWDLLFADAAARKDIAQFERLLATVKAKKAGDARLKRYLRQLEDQLAELKSRQG